MRLRLLLAVSVIAVLALVVAAVGVGPSDDADSSPDEPAADGEVTPGSGILPAEVNRYVALGDSYTAGPLIRWVHNDPPGCLRSSRNYPALLAQWLDVGKLVDVSCSGADSGDITGAQDAFGQRVPPQLGAVTADTDLVTVGIGGNDFGLFSDLAQGLRPPGIATTLARAGARVGDVLARVRDRAPDAVVAVVGYPRIVPTDGSCSVLPFGPADNRYLDGVEGQLNRELQRAAVGAGAVWVDTYGPSRGHHACAGDDAWVNGARTMPLRALALHPFETGMQATATAVHETLRGRPPAPAVRRAAAAALAPRPRDAFSRQGQRLAASLLGG